MNQPISELSYWGFISHSSKDAAVAARLHRALESYRLPRDLAGRLTRDGTPVPARLSPIYLDRDEQPQSADLGAAVESALRDSRYLIVICSPEAAASRWVNEEVRYFCSLGREEDVLPLIVRGEPNATGKTGRGQPECFPPALRFRVGPDGALTEERSKISGWDLRKEGDGFFPCLLKALGGMTGFGYNALATRAEARKRRRRRAALITASCLLATAAAWWDSTRTKVAHFAQITERFGVPEGAMPLKAETQLHRTLSYRVETRQFKTRRILAVNSAGTPQEPAGESILPAAAIQQLSYGSGGELERIDQQSALGDPIGRMEIVSRAETAEGVVILAKLDSPTPGPGTEAGGASGKVSRIVYDRDGLPLRHLFLDAGNHPLANADGAYGKAYRFDENRLLIESINLGPDGQPAPARNGVAIVRFHRGVLGEVTRVSHFGANGAPVTGPGGWHQVETALDPSGNVQEEHFQDATGSLAPNADGVTIIRYQVDWNGYVREKSFHASDGKPVLSLSHGTAKEAASYDEAGRVIGRAYFGLDGNPALCSHNICRYVDQLSPKGLPVERTFFDPEGQPTVRKDRFPDCFEATSDSPPPEWLAVAVTPAAPTDGPATDAGPGVSGPRPAGQEVAVLPPATPPAAAEPAGAGATLAATQEPATVPVLGAPEAESSAPPAMPDQPGTQAMVASAEMPAPLATPDAAPASPSSTSEAESSAPPAMPAPSSAVGAVAAAEMPAPLATPDAAPASSSSTSEAESSAPPAMPAPSSAVGSVAAAEVLATPAAPATLAMAESSPSASTPIAEPEPPAPAPPERPSLAPKALAGIHDRTELNAAESAERLPPRAEPSPDCTENGNEVALRFANAAGKSVVCRGGYAGWLAKFDERGNEIERTYLDLDGKPVADSHGVTRWTREYGPDGRETTRRFFDAEGTAVLSKEGIAGWTSEFDERGNLVKGVCLGLDGQPALHKDGYAKWAANYDSDGRVTEKAFYGLDGALVLIADGGAGWASQYDGQGHEIERAYFGPDGQPALRRDGYATWKASFDERGHEVERSFLGVDGQPVADANGIARWRKEYDDQGRETKRTFLDAKGNPVQLGEGIAGWTSRLDDRGNVIEGICFGANGKPAVHRDGYARWKSKFDEHGNEIERAYFGLDGKAVANRLGMHRRTARYDARGYEIESARFDTAGKPVLNRNGYHREQARFDERGQKLEQAWFGLKDEPVINASPSFGAAKYAWTYNQRGDVLETARFGLDGKPLNGPGGWALERKEYHPATGKLLTTRRYNAEGSPVALE